MPRGWNSMLTPSRAGGNGASRGVPPGTPVLTPTGDQVLPDKAREQRGRWDTIRLVSGSLIQNPIEMFRVPQGRAGDGFPLKTSVTTNMILPNQLERGVAINVSNVRVAIYAVGTARLGDLTMQRLAALWEDTRLVWKVNDTEELNARLKEFTSGSGMTGVTQMNAPAPRTFIAPSPTVRFIRQLAREVFLPARVTFSMRIEINQNNAFLQELIGNGQDLAIRVGLYGIISRPIE